MYILQDFDKDNLPQNVSDYRLCYVDRNDDKVDKDEDITHYGYQLYFTTALMKDQWGDDWDDAPYDLNASDPYDTHRIDGERVEHIILVLQIWVKAEDWLMMPLDFSYNSFAVSDINSGAVAWLYKPAEGKSCNGISVHAGMTPQEVSWMIGHLFVERYFLNKKTIQNESKHYQG